MKVLRSVENGTYYYLIYERLVEKKSLKTVKQLT